MVSELTGSFVVFHNFVVEDGEVKGEAELDGVAWGQLDLVSLVVSLKSLLLNLFHKVTLGVLSDVAVVITDHLDEESLRFTIAWLGKHLGVNHVNDTLAVSGELVFDLGFICGEGTGVLGVLRVLLDCGNSAACGTLGGDEVLESNGEKVAFIAGNLGTFCIEDESEEVDHIFESLSLFGNTGEENVLFN